MIPFGTIEPVRVVSVRTWVSKREKERAAKAGEPERQSCAIRVVPAVPDSEHSADEPVEFFLAPGVNGHTPAEGEIVHLRLGARARGWERETLIHPDGSRETNRRNMGTAYSVRDVEPVAAA